MEFIKEILKWFQLQTKYFFVIGLVSSLLLFLPSSILTKFRLDVFVDTYHLYIVLACLVSYGVIIVNIAPPVGKFVVRLGRGILNLIHITGKLKNLNQNEIRILREFLYENRKRTVLDDDSADIKVLLRDGIIINEGDSVYKIHFLVWKCLHRKLDLLD